MKIRDSRAFSVGVVLVLAAACAGNKSASAPSVLSPSLALEVGEVLGDRPAFTKVKPDEVLVRAPVQRVWPALLAVWAELKVPVTAADSSTHTLVSSRRRVRRIDGVRVDQYFECTGAYENNASRGDLFLELRSQALPEGEGHTVVQTAVAAQVRPADNSALIACPSNGRLQQLIRERLDRKLGLASPS